MLESIESFVLRQFSKEKGLACELARLERGISNVNFKVTLTGRGLDQAKQVVMTILPDPATWWRIDKERFLRKITDHDADVLLPRIINSGKAEWGKQKIAFIVREFVAGCDLDTVLEEGVNKGFRDGDWSVIARDLGFRLGALHTHPLSFVGPISGTQSQLSRFSSWKDFFTQALEVELTKFHSYPRAKQVGSCRVDHIVSLFPLIKKFVGSHLSALETVTNSCLIHGDPRFANVIVDRDKDSVWRIKALIDLEGAMAGDPEADLVGIENWLYCSRYQAHFYRAKLDFMTGYNAKRTVSPQYGERRFLYHTIGSLSFLGGIFAPYSQHVQAHPSIVRSVEKNYRILHSLAHGDYLENLNIPPIDDHRKEKIHGT